MPIRTFACSAILAIPFALIVAQTPADKSSLVVDTEWLSSHLQDENLVVLHAGWRRTDYKVEHIPGARFLWIEGFTKGTPDLGTELPDAVQADSMLESLGITDRSRIVVYTTGQNLSVAARMIMTLEYFGLGGRVSLLDGGFEAWKREGRPVTKEFPGVERGSYTTKIHPEILVTADWIQKNLSAPHVTVVDARAPQFYEGKSGGMPRPGHIQGAVNIPFSSVTDSTGRFLKPETLKEMFTKAGVKPGSEVVTYCHVGQQASLLYIVAKYLGYNARLYDGSFEEWSSREDLPIENPSAKK